MEKFKFRFASVLRVRKAREETALRSLSVAQKALQADFEAKNRLLQELQNSLLRREKYGEGESVASAIMAESDYIQGTKHRITQAEHAIVRENRGVEKALRFYLNAKRQTRAIEILYDKALEEYKKKASKEEQKNADDLLTIRSNFSQYREDTE